MQRNRSYALRKLAGLAALALGILVLAPVGAQAADNTATGDIAGVGADLDDSNTFTLNSTTLALLKTAFQSGVELSSGDTLPKGTLVQFMIYVDNATAFGVNDINVSDLLDVGFSYQLGSIKVDNSEATGATTAAIYAAVNATVALTDLNDGDVAGISGATITAGTTGGNGAVNAAASTVWAMLFDVTVQ